MKAVPFSGEMVGGQKRESSVCVEARAGCGGRPKYDSACDSQFLWPHPPLSPTLPVSIAPCSSKLFSLFPTSENLFLCPPPSPRFPPEPLSFQFRRTFAHLSFLLIQIHRKDGKTGI